MHVDSAYSEALKLEALELYNLQLDDQNHCVLTKDKRLLSSYYPGHEIFEWENCYLVITSEPPQITKPVTEYLVISSEKPRFNKWSKRHKTRIYFYRFSN